MRKSILFYPLFFIAIHLSAQDLHIYYDAQTELLRYELEGKAIQQPKAQSGSNIFLHIKNYNNYLFEVEVGANESTINIPTSSSNALSGLLSGKGGGRLPTLNLFSATANDESAASREQTEEEPVLSHSREIDLSEENEKQYQVIQDLSAEYSEILNTMNQAEAELMAIGKAIKIEFQKKQKLKVIAKEITKLKQHPQLKPTQIKKMASEYFQTVFTIADIKTIDMNYILSQTSLKEQLGQLKEKEELYQNELERVEELVEISNEFNLEGTSIMQSLQKTQKDGQGFLSKAKAYQKKLNELTSEFQKEDMEYLADLRYEFEAINSNDFSYTYRTTAKEDAIIFNVKFKKKALGENEVTTNKTIAPIEVAISGGFKLNASLGLSFGGFNETPQDYFVREETIKADDIGGLKPLLTSFLHFYKQSNGNTSLGGSVGIGFPLAGDRNITSLSFLAGPALMIGKSSRIVISAGVMAGQVDRLAQGYEIGDTFISEVDNVPVKQVYELGFFVGISYNL